MLGGNNHEWQYYGEKSELVEKFHRFNMLKHSTTLPAAFTVWQLIECSQQRDFCFKCRSLRKTFGYFAWKSGVLPVMPMDIFNHSSFEITRRYRGISQEDRDKIYMNMAVFVEQIFFFLDSEQIFAYHVSM